MYDYAVARAKPLGRRTLQRLDIRAENRKLNVHNVRLMGMVPEHRQKEEDMEARHQLELQKLEKEIKTKDEKILDMDTEHKQELRRLKKRQGN